MVRVHADGMADYRSTRQRQKPGGWAMAGVFRCADVAGRDCG